MEKIMTNLYFTIKIAVIISAIIISIIAVIYEIWKWYH